VTREALVLVFMMFVGTVAMAVGEAVDQEAAQLAASAQEK